jgi:hypothetical protein
MALVDFVDKFFLQEAEAEPLKNRVQHDNFPKEQAMELAKSCYLLRFP